MISLISGTVTELRKINHLDKWENYTIFNSLISLNSVSVQEISKINKLPKSGISRL
ncbi:protein of unknown function [Xenorhabdus bovienii]|uniref:Uncharacterized protein n=1 Tax=Xenorhabdus bovienii TaxID=40576 RepID=A0A0B6X664_XENBV|nr:protein of unknown function [Xenorhabdus bovienii]